MKKIIIIFYCVLVSLYGDAQVLHGNVNYKEPYYFNGHTITFSEPISIVVQGVSRKSIPVPKKIDGKDVVKVSKVENEPQIARYKNFQSYIRERMKKSFEMLPNGSYIMPTCNLIIDEKGKLIFYDYREITPMSGNLQHIQGTASKMQMTADLNQNIVNKKSVQNFNLPDSLIKLLNKEMLQALQATPNFSPAKVEGKSVPCLLFPNYDFNDIIEVKDGSVSYTGGLTLPADKKRK